ncbi:hypothetical protein D9611_001377 [Ephemerocybe angulata]|uniref:Uncharacterized protein n=1 Tax=Ephemerocybe angulata TaxID=980116 RepID=A0A8H5CHI5_9AGAR|nr:hypothetical protein D9611_001377 [Tulosesus angulatus]
MTVPGPSGLSRFHAIVSATPRDAFGPPVINAQFLRPIDYASSSSDTASTKKRKRDGDGDEVMGRAGRNPEGRSVRQPDLYEDRQQLLNALRDQFQRGPDVEFHGSYEMEDAEVTHKQRIQTLTHEIWKTTGYRFTVKDHPRVNNGHKTRFWCSQDEAHRNKFKGARAGDIPKPRLTSSGDAMAKTRYPCRSRLLISSRDSGAAGKRVITIRIAHHLAHEPYIDATLPPEVSKTICESFGWFTRQNGVDAGFGEGSSSDVAFLPVSVSHTMQPPISVAPSQLHEALHPSHTLGIDEDDGDEADSPEEDEPHHYGAPVEGLSTPVQGIADPDPTTTSAPVYMAHPPPPIPPPIAPDIYEQRMRAHIANIREFCDGLDYNLQFRDTRMLEMVEKEGASFLRLVEDCLSKEGRLVPVPEHNVPPLMNSNSRGSVSSIPQHMPGFDSFPS